MGRASTRTIGIYWKPPVWDLARAAYTADLIDDPECPVGLIGWLDRALAEHARRSPKDRARLVEAREWPADNTHRKGFNQAHPLGAETLEAVEEAITADLEELSRPGSRSRFAQEAVLVAAEQARRRRGRPLPPPPRELPNRPMRRPLASN
ncbi:MAG: hypothetical protein L0H74_00220 [Brachybacterium sp.]|nr:hypothetical protein [Brachybacterium sp.]